MTHRDIDRRTVLQAGGAAALAGMAGCLGVFDDDDDGTPEYAQYLATAEEEVFFVYADFEGLEAFDDEDDEEPDDDFDDFEEPLLAAPLGGIFLLAFAAGFTLAPAGLDDLLESEDESDLDSQGQQVLFSNEVTIVAGEMDTEEIGAELTAEPEDDFFGIQYEEDTEIGAFTLYTPMEEEGPLFAVSSDEVLAGETQAQIETVIDAIDGEGRAADEFDEFEWLLDTAGDGLIAVGGYGPDGFDGFDEDGDDVEPDEELDEIDDANGFTSSLAFTETELNASFAASFDELDESDHEEIEAEFQSDRTEVTIEFDGNRMTAEATYEEEVIDEEGPANGA